MRTGQIILAILAAGGSLVVVLLATVRTFGRRVAIRLIVAVAVAVVIAIAVALAVQS